MKRSEEFTTKQGLSYDIGMTYLVRVQLTSNGIRNRWEPADRMISLLFPRPPTFSREMAIGPNPIELFASSLLPVST